MKCPSCGAEVGTSKFCEFCGTQISSEMRREQEQLNMKGCPECGSTNIQFRRENQGEIRGKQSKQVIHRTVGFCKDCGATWYPNSAANAVPKKRKTWLWVLGWLFIFPVPLTILMLRKKEMKPVLKYGIIAVAWIIYLIIGIGGNSNKEETTNTTPVAAVSETLSDNTVSETINGNNAIYSDAEIIDLMNGFGTEKVGKKSVVRADQSACTEEALIDWYCNYVLEHTDCNYHLIVYTDNPAKGVYAMSGGGFIQKDITLIPDDDGTYSLGDDAGSTIYTINTETKALTVQAVMVDETVVNEVAEKVDGVIPDDYKNGELYSVDVAGEDGNLDCNVTIINESFSDADYQSIAEDLATTIKALDLGIGYFCIAFQSDDYTLNAISNIDSLSGQDVSEISTTTFG